tara:strand:+ start:463 stop:564 length:102 start_codon:yes stop_codon:yes gene_type:complete
MGTASKGVGAPMFDKIGGVSVAAEGDGISMLAS